MHTARRILWVMMLSTGLLSCGGSGEDVHDVDRLSLLISSAREATEARHRAVVVTEMEVPRPSERGRENAAIDALGRLRSQVEGATHAVSEALMALNTDEMAILGRTFKNLEPATRLEVLRGLRECPDSVVTGFCISVDTWRPAPGVESMMLSWVIAWKGCDLPFELVNWLTRSEAPGAKPNAIGALIRVADHERVRARIHELQSEPLDEYCSANLEVVVRELEKRVAGDRE